MDGVLRYAKAVDWRVQTVPYAMASLVTRPDASRLCCRWKTAIDRWKPAGVIVESGAICAELSVREFGKLPAVFLDREAERGAACVTSDAQAIAEAALEPLLQGRAAPRGVTRFGPLMVLRRASTHGSGRRNPDVAASIARIRREALVSACEVVSRYWRVRDAAAQLARYAKDRDLARAWRLREAGGTVPLPRIAVVFHGGDVALREEI